jgi:hypothetical protein
LTLVFSLVALGVPRALHRPHHGPGANRLAALARIPSTDHPHSPAKSPDAVCLLCTLLATPQVLATPATPDLHPAGWAYVELHRAIGQRSQSSPLTLRSRGPPAA